jgi:Domain of unknown function (DUF4253)
MAEEQREPGLPAGLGVLFGDGGARRSLPVTLPAGRLVRPNLDRLRPDPEPTTVAQPAYWLSEQPATATLWRRLHAEHARSGLWPLLLQGLDDRPQRPWVAGEVDPEPAGEVDSCDAAGFLATMWTNWVERAAEEEGGACDFHELAPFGRAWPGLAPAGAPLEDPVVVADRYAGLLADGTPRLGLVAADCSADALAVTGWLGPRNYVQRTAPLAAVVRSWEERFGVRVVGIGFDTLHLSVAAPPATPEHALQVAAEHFAFCPDNVLSDLIGFSPNPLAAYAEQLRGEQSWAFWWD